MLDAKQLIPELFDLGPLRTRMAKAKWMKDLVERGMAPTDVELPKCRVSRSGYWAEPDPCETPVDNIYGEQLPKEGQTVLEPGHRPQARAARGMVSTQAQGMLCEQLEGQNRMDDRQMCGVPQSALF